MTCGFFLFLQVMRSLRWISCKRMNRKSILMNWKKNGLASSSGMTRLKSATWIDGIVPYELESGLG